MNKKAQVILIVLIISALILTIGLSLSRRAVVETKIDTDEELLKQAFNTAESGIQYYLGTGITSYVSSNNAENANVKVTALGTGSSLDFNEYFIENNPAIFWLVGHNTTGDIDYSTYYTANNINICVSNSFAGSLKVDLFYKNGNNFGVNRQGYNFNTGANKVTGFSDQSGVAQGSCGAEKKAVNLGIGGTPLLLSISPIWSGTKISLTGSANFPSQGSEISSTGRAGDLQSGVNRKVTILDRYRIPPFMLEAITAGNSVTN